MSTHPIIAAFENSQLRADQENLPSFAPGDTVSVHVKLPTELSKNSKAKTKEKKGRRTQLYTGVVIGKRNRGLNSSFTVRKVAHGIGVERVFLLHGRSIEKIEVKRKGDVRQAKLYYLRGLSGKKARIKEKFAKRVAKDAIPAK